MQVIKRNFQQHGDKRGMLVALEEGKDIPFEVKKINYIYDIKEDIQGEFCIHHDLEQILICVNGMCRVLVNDGVNQEEVFLEKPCEGLYTPSGIKCDIYEASKEAVLLVLKA